MDEVLIDAYLYHDITDDADYEYFGFSSTLGLNLYWKIVDTASGDVNGDAREDFVLLLMDTGPEYTIIAYGSTESGDWNDIEEIESYEDNIDCADDTLVDLAVGNVDEDSNRVRCTGHELQFSQPSVIAVLASPPYYAEIAEADEGYNYDDWITTFGRSTSSSGSSESSVGYSVGTTLGYSAGYSLFGVEIASFEASVSFTAETSSSFTTTTTVSKEITYSCAGGENRVIFTSVPIDVYTYEVLYSEDSSDIGEEMTISIPREFSQHTVELDFYNENNGTLEDIVIEPMSHTIGSPWSYPDEADAEGFLDEFGGYSYDAESVGQGSGNSGITEMTITVEEGEETTVSMDYTTEAVAEATLLGVMSASSAGFNTGYSYTTATSVGTIFGGTVGFLPTAYYTNSYIYESGLFAIPYEDEDIGQTYWVVSYWVE